MWLVVNSLIYDLIGCFRSKLSDFEDYKVCNQTNFVIAQAKLDSLDLEQPIEP